MVSYRLTWPVAVVSPVPLSFWPRVVDNQTEQNFHLKKYFAWRTANFQFERYLKKSTSFWSFNEKYYKKNFQQKQAIEQVFEVFLWNRLKKVHDFNPSRLGRGLVDPPPPLWPDRFQPVWQNSRTHPSHTHMPIYGMIKIVCRGHPILHPPQKKHCFGKDKV
jgi:hypothetical protein